MILLVYLAAAVSNPTPTELESLQSETRRYSTCIERAALELEPSGEPASTVLTAAVTSCKSQRERVEETFVVDLIMRGETPSSGRIQRALEEIDRRFKEQTLP